MATRVNPMGVTPKSETPRASNIKAPVLNVGLPKATPNISTSTAKVDEYGQRIQKPNPIASMMLPKK